MATREELDEYKVKLAEYERAQIDYEARKREWDSLGPEARAKLNAEAEAGSRAFWSLALWCGLVYLAYTLMAPRLAGTTFWVAFGAVAVVLLGVCIVFARAVGLLVRAVVWAALGGALGGVVAVVGGEVIGHEVSSRAAIAVACVVALLGFFAGIGPRTAAGPTRPSPPPKPK